LHLAGVESPARRALVAATLVLLKCRGNDREKSLYRRLAIKDSGRVEIHDTGNHRIFGVAQAQSADQTLTFTSQDGLVRVKDLPKVAE
jgi:hypothetical protein